MNDTVRDAVIAAAAIGVVYFFWKDQQANSNGKNTRPNRNKITKAPVISATSNNASGPQSQVLTGGASPDGNY